MLRVSERGFAPNTPEKLREATSRIRNHRNLVFSCAWIGMDSEVHTFGESDGDATRADRAFAVLHPVAVRYWAIKGPENIGDAVAGFVYDAPRSFGMNGVRIVGEGENDWLMRVMLPDRGVRSHADIAVVGGELVRASFIDAKRTVTPMLPRDVNALSRRMRGRLKADNKPPVSSSV